MKKQPAKIKFIKTEEGFNTPSDTRQIITDALLHRQEVNFKQIDPAEARSIDHNNFYWSVILPLVAEWCDGMWKYVVVSDRCNKNYNALHRYLTFEYCLRHNRDDLCENYRTVHNGEIINVAIASFSFDKMKHKDAVAYTGWVEDVFKLSSGGIGFNEMVARQKREVK